MRKHELERIIANFESYVECRQKQVEDVQLASVGTLPVSFQRLINETKQINPQDIQNHFEAVRANARKCLELAQSASKVLTDQVNEDRELSNLQATVATKYNAVETEPSQISIEVGEEVQILDRWTSDIWWKISTVRETGYVPSKCLTNIPLILRTNSGSEYFSSRQWEYANLSFFHSFYQPEILATARKIWNELNEYKAQWHPPMGASPHNLKFKESPSDFNTIENWVVRRTLHLWMKWLKKCPQEQSVSPLDEFSERYVFFFKILPLLPEE